MNLKEAFDFTCSVRETWSPTAKGFVTCKINVNHLFNVFGEDFPMEDVDTMTYVTLTKVLKSDGKSPATINRVMYALSTMHNTLVKFGHLDKQVQKTTLKEPKGRMLYYTEQEIKDLLKACDEMGYKGVLVKDVVRFGYLTGSRQGEILKLQWSDVDYTDNTLQFQDTKNGETRVLPLTNGLKELLSEIWDRRVSDELVFPLDKDTLLRRFKQAQEIAGINQDKVFHTLRHTAATALFAKGAPLPVVKQVLGHKNTNTTLRYAKATPEGMTAALDSLELSV
jgi:integrase